MTTIEGPSGRVALYSFWGVDGEPGFEDGKGFGHIAAAVTETNVPRFIVNGAGQKKNARLSNELFAEGLDVLLRLETSEADGTGVGRGPFEKVSVAGKEGTELTEIAERHLQVAVDEFLPVAQGKRSQKLARSAGADGGVVLKGNDFP